jgi:hypothetical protein
MTKLTAEKKKMQQVSDLGVRGCWVRDFMVGVVGVSFVLTGLGGRAWDDDQGGEGQLVGLCWRRGQSSPE